MNTEEQLVADQLYAAILDYSRYDERSQQAAEFKVGVSDLGYCSERTRRMLKQEVPHDTDVLAAFIGTALGKDIEAASHRAWPDVITQSTVEIVLKGDRGDYTISGHPDMVVPSLGMMLDGKTKHGLAVVERTGANQQQRFQRHGYGLGAWKAGMFGDLPIEEVVVGNVWLDRSGQQKRLHVELEHLDLEVITQMGQWLDEVVEAYINDHEAMKEPARQVCETTCGFFSTCRAYDTDVTGLITDDEHLAAVALNKEGAELKKAGTQMMDAAKASLRGVSGSTGEYTVRWVHVNETVVASRESVRAAYDRLDIRALKKK